MHEHFYSTLYGEYGESSSCWSFLYKSFLHYFTQQIAYIIETLVFFQNGTIEIEIYLTFFYKLSENYTDLELELKRFLLLIIIFMLQH